MLNNSLEVISLKYVIDNRLLGYINSLSTKPFLKEFVSYLAKVAFLH